MMLLCPSKGPHNTRYAPGSPTSLIRHCLELNVSQTVPVWEIERMILTLENLHSLNTDSMWFNVFREERCEKLGGKSSLMTKSGAWSTIHPDRWLKTTQNNTFTHTKMRKLKLSLRKRAAQYILPVLAYKSNSQIYSSPCSGLMLFNCIRISARFYSLSGSYPFFGKSVF